MALAAALSSKAFEEALTLVDDMTNFGVPEGVLTPEVFPLADGVLTGEMALKLWAKYQADKIPAEEGEDPKTASEEYPAELAAELEGVDPATAGYVVKVLMSVGFYFGDRAAAAVEATGDKSFDLEQGARSGMGVSLLSNGDVYCGGYVDGKREGTGVLKAAAGQSYAGTWVGGKRAGMGVMKYADGGKYMGNWKGNKRHGTGTFTYASGDAYAGSWHAGQKHGAGTYKASAASCVYEGTWLFGTLKASKLIMTSAQGAAYYGAFDKEGRPTGEGAFAFGNGVSLTGKYDAPPVPEAEGEEAPVAAPSTWVGGSIGAVEATTGSSFSGTYTTVKPPLNVIIAGAPASGKGTQAEKIVAEYGLFHLSTGDLLREAAADPENEIGQQAAAVMAEGGLVSDDIMLGLVTQKLDDPAVREKGWLLDGFPRTAVQAAALDDYFLVPTKCVIIDVPNEVLVSRVTGRRKDPETGIIYHIETKKPLKEDGEVDEEIMARLEQRADDTPEALEKRLVAFGANRDAIAAAFSSIALSVDGNRPPDEVFADIKAFFDK